MESFSTQGEWWLPQFPDRKVVGTLTFEPNDGARLDLFGALHQWRGVIASGPDGAYDPSSSGDEGSGIYERIVGCTDKQSITLGDCFRTSLSNLLNSDRQAETIYVNEVYTGAEFGAGEPIEAIELVQSLKYLTHWVSPPVIRQEWPITKDDAAGRSASLMRATVAPFPVVRFKVTKTLEGHLKQTMRLGGDGVTEVRVAQDIAMSLRSKRLVSFDDLFDDATLFQHLVSIGINRTAVTQRLNLLHPDMAWRVGRFPKYHPITFFARLADISDQESDRPYREVDTLFHFADIGGALGISRWMRVARKHRSSLGRLMISRYRKRMHAADLLIHGSAALEAFDRKNNGNAPVGRRHRTFADRMRYCADLAGPTFEKLVGDSALWIKLYKKQRDDIAHHLERNMIGAGALYRPLVDSAYLLYVIAILREAGMHAGVFESIERSHHFEIVGRQVRGAIVQGQS